ncbi:MAG: hypothetical protein L0287_28635, partial [Anaerolineae bacterium]|nr:hypothetical protein [Anaerolineae bacterium]
ANVDIDSSLVTALGGPTVLEDDGGPGENGGAGGNGRIHIEYCNLISGTSDPPAIEELVL